ncbi:hypothetical protein ABBQ38_003787 [Trebouxia sp. C0009 RCD-2024]
MQACLQEHQPDGWDDNLPDPPLAPRPPSKPAASCKQQKKKAQAARHKAAQRTPVATPTPTQDTMPEHDVQPTSPTLSSPTPLADPVPPTLPHPRQATVGSSMDAAPPPPGYTGLATAQQRGSRTVTAAISTVASQRAAVSSTQRGSKTVSAALSTVQSPKAVSDMRHPQTAGSWATIAAKGTHAASTAAHRNDSGASLSGSWSSTAASPFQSAHLSDYEAMQLAMQASLGPEHATTPTYLAAAQQRSPQAGTGLRNDVGENNCFLNAIMQSLWHCATFRRAVLQWPLHAYQGCDVASAFRSLIEALEQQGLGHSQQVIDPTQLRTALSQLPGNKFSAGAMSDAAEMLVELYKHLATAAARTEQPQLMACMFGLHVQESVECRVCRASTRKQEYDTYFYDVTACELAAEERRQPRRRLGQLLHAIEAASHRACSKDEGGCGKVNTVQHRLHPHAAPPVVFTLQLAWLTANANEAFIRTVMLGLRQELDLADMYHGLHSGAHVYWLSSMTCYYGSHYVTYALRPDSKWYRFSDACVTQIGSWRKVMQSCTIGRHQPSLLFYEKR